MKKQVSKAMALDRPESLCVAAERCESELRRKLFLWQISSADAEAIMEHLRRNRFVSDERFARSFVCDKYRLALWGRRKIVSELMAKRVDASFIRQALEEIEEEIYTENARKVIKAKMRSIKDVNTYDGRTRLFRYAVGRGYEPSLVASVIKDPSIWTGEDS